jgi:hypothetical protein
MTQNSHPPIEERVLAGAAAAFVFKDGTARMEVSGTSMLPILRHGDMVQIRQVPLSEKVREGHVYAFVNNGSLILHRIHRCKKNMLLALGDNMLNPHSVSRRDILGELVSPRLRNHETAAVIINRLFLLFPRHCLFFRLRRKTLRYILLTWKQKPRQEKHTKNRRFFQQKWN